MIPASHQEPKDEERRTAKRHDVHGSTICRAADVLDEVEVEAGPWNISMGGACLLLESQFPPGARLALALWNRGTTAGLHVCAEVKYALCCPSYHKMWLTGCAFTQEVSEDDLRPYR
jgi:hypothetical protein